MLRPKIRFTSRYRALRYEKSWKAGLEIPVPESPPTELLPDVLGDESQLHEIAEATRGTFPHLVPLTAWLPVVGERRQPSGC